ncbi:MAG TPA: carbohydrate binding family 9 domain-containing protein, partial [Gemmatimonadales bacterium]|nr:carbohydrate binding family 9 domain-containing protein [Gemmatimonadales bacterium]
MLAALFFAVAAAQGHLVTVAIPRFDTATVTIDGRLAEGVWTRAALLRDFSQYLPNDNRAADDSTTVLVWYGPSAIYFGVRAYQDSASVRATLADRDRIAGDDYIEILLDTFNDHRQALVFGVNPLGVQADGTLLDAPRQVATTLSAASTGAYALDLSPDFVYQSKGHVTSWGYEVEIRIPFKTLRYQTHDPQDWSVNVIRVVQATGHQHTWTRVLQTRASFLGQSGTLSGLTGLQRGLVLDVTPEATSTVTGTPETAGWTYRGGAPHLGATVRWGVTANLTLN